MDYNIESFKITLASFLATFASFFGNTKKHIVLLIILMCIDTLFGWVKGFKTKCWLSKKARWGIYGKIIELILICILYFFNWVFNVEFIVYIGLYYFIAVEIASIFENYSEINKNLPKGFVELLKKFQFSIGTLVIKKLTNFIEKTIKIDEHKGDKNNENK